MHAHAQTCISMSSCDNLLLLIQEIIAKFYRLKKTLLGNKHKI